MTARLARGVSLNHRKGRRIAFCTSAGPLARTRCTIIPAAVPGVPRAAVALTRATVRLRATAEIVGAEIIGFVRGITEQDILASNGQDKTLPDFIDLGDGRHAMRCPARHRTVATAHGLSATPHQRRTLPSAAAQMAMPVPGGPAA